MSDERRRPFGLPSAPRDRDVYTAKTPPRGIDCAPEPVVDDEVTGRYQGDDLTRARERRPTPERLRILERKHDALNESVTEIRVGVGKMGGQMDVLLNHILPKQVEEQETARARIVTLPKLIRAIGYALALVIAALVGKGAL